MTTDKNGKEIKLVDYEARGFADVQVGTTGHEFWVCIDGFVVLRIKSPNITIVDRRIRR